MIFNETAQRSAMCIRQRKNYADVTEETVQQSESFRGMFTILIKHFLGKAFLLDGMFEFWATFETISSGERGLLKRLKLTYN